MAGRIKRPSATAEIITPLGGLNSIAPTFPHGGFGENFTIAGLSEQTACIGDTYQIGEARVQVSQPRGPCWKIARRWRIEDLTARVLATGRTGWYLRVLTEGPSRRGSRSSCSTVRTRNGRLHVSTRSSIIAAIPTPPRSLPARSSMRACAPGSQSEAYRAH